MATRAMERPPRVEHELGRARPRPERSAPARPIVTSAWFLARHAGVCDRCGQPYEGVTPVRVDLDGLRALCCLNGDDR